MKLQNISAHAATLLSHGGAAGLIVVMAGAIFDSATLVIVGLLTMILATYAAIMTDNRAF